MNIAARISIDPAAKSYVSKPRQLLIDGKWVNAASGKTFPVYDPSTGEVMVQVAEADAADVDKAVKAARKAFDEGPWPRMSPSERGRLLWKRSDLIEKHADEFATLEALDNGKPLTVARVADVPLAVDMFRYMAGWATKITGHDDSDRRCPVNILSYTLREPVGVVGQIIPWNFPLLMAAWKLAPALGGGCTVVLKVGEQTPLSALRLGELFGKPAIPPGVVNILTGFGETAGAALAAHPRCRQGRLHWFDRSRQADRPSGRGKSEKSVARTRRQIAGDRARRRRCRCRHSRRGERDLLQSWPMLLRRIASVCAQEDLRQGRRGRRRRGQEDQAGTRSRSATEMGPLVSDEQFERVTGYIESGVKEGAKIVTGGKKGSATAAISSSRPFSPTPSRT